jgi:hypothetical protein
MPQPNAKHDELRRRALLIALSRQPGSHQDVLSWHPDRELVETAEPIGATDFRDLLFEELRHCEESLPSVFQREIDTDNPGRVHFWQRRRNADCGRRWRVAQERLPGFWLRHLELPTHRIRRHCRDLGVELLLAATHGDSKEELVGFLRPLGGVFAREFVKKLRQRSEPPEPKERRRRWRDASAQVGRRPGVETRGEIGESLATALGIRVLATLFRRLPTEDRRLANRISVSNIGSVMENTEPLVCVEAEEMETLERLCSKVDMGDLRR